MRESVKQRIVGAVVLVALGIIFIPVLFTLDSPREVDTESMIPPAPDIEPLVVGEPRREEGFIPPKPMEDAFMPAEPPAAEESVASAAFPERDFVPAEAVATGRSATPVDAPAHPTEPVAERPALAGNLVEAWVIQIASLRKKEDAEEFSGKLRTAGYKAYVRSAEVQGAATHRVFVGPVAVRAQAESDKAAIDKGFGVQSLIVRFEP